MSTYAISRDIAIDAPILVVWNTITEPRQICTWFSDDADLEARPGALGTLTFEGDDKRLVVNITVVAAERPHRFSFRWVSPPGAEATTENSVLVTFTLTPDGEERTHLRVVESGLEDVIWPDDEKRRYVEEHRRGWEKHGDRLQGLFRAPRGS